MKYESVVTGIFVNRPNRFIAHVLTDGRQVVAHVKNTGRCRELLIPGVRVVLQYHPEAAKKGRKTEYDLICVYKGDLLINMDSQAPNQAAWEWLTESPSLLAPYGHPAGARREVTHGDSRFDLSFTLERQQESQQAFMEVKGVTLEENGIVRFPDAPTERGVKHLKGLIRAKEKGYEAFVLFVIQMKGVSAFEPNDSTHPAFGEALRQAAAAGVHVLAVDCFIEEDSMRIGGPVEVRL